MSWFDKLRGKKQEDPLPPKPASPQPLAPTKAKTFKVWDSYGRMMEISSEDWRTKVLPNTLRAKWDKPDELYDLIAMALKDGFLGDCLDACRRLSEIDTKPPRGAIALGVTLLQLEHFK